MYINVPFSKTAHWLIFGLQQWFKGKNVVVLCQSRSLDSQLISKMYGIFADEVYLGRVRF